MRKVLTGNQAVAYGAMLSGVEVVAAYPITPQTTIIETLADMQAEGLGDFDYIRVSRSTLPWLPVSVPQWEG